MTCPAQDLPRPPRHCADLVDYLRKQLDLAAAPSCACPDLDVTSPDDLRRGERAFVKGYADGCPIHGLDGTEPMYRRAIS